ncbi:MAG: Trm112 family protein [Candidatus Omnitrophica bacterium]|nr:Trm112 family protein [Candidatus Omnitrophota bacterium]
MIRPELLEILVCPACKTKVVLKGESLLCTNAACGLRFPIRDGIPVMLIEEAEKPPH